MKKWMGLLLSLTLVFTLAACGGGGSQSQPAPTTGGDTPATQTTDAGSELKPEPGAKLIVWEGKEQQAYLEEMGKAFEEKYGVPVEYQELGSADQMARVKQDGPAGLGADVMMMPHDQLGEAVAAGLILPNDYYEEDTKKNFIPTAVDAVTFDGTMYGYPRNMETYLLYYNKNLVKAEDLQSWDSIIKFAKGYNDVSKNKFGFMWEVNNWYFAYSFIGGYGGYIFGDNNTNPKDIGLNTPEAVEAMKFYASLREILPINATDASGDVKTELFQSGKLPINLDGIWQMSNFTKEKLGFEVGAVPMPKLPNGKNPAPFAGVKSYFVSSFTQYPNAAKLFINFLTTEEALTKNAQMTGIIPARNGMENNAEIIKDERAKAFVEQFKMAQPMPSIIEMRQVWGPATATLELIWNGKDPKEVLDKAVNDMKTGIEQQSKS
ncbi:sugar ABC transporter substrate-binding protein [Paenibacillus sp. 481]|uniref:sugar ABC transporter substrate-binding protein n=1 Tax=Paenibacillus sp. 481 TaxID=2835869 RepID=UPI001E64188E|nr:maltose ABC transporter substrate-binding protein [Paenibacillus sp. 481]UHA72313.1 maltose ABC transporter substrate-binding protein [Paenibacillus sp. 481]